MEALWSLMIFCLLGAGVPFLVLFGADYKDSKPKKPVDWKNFTAQEDCEYLKRLGIKPDDP